MAYFVHGASHTLAAPQKKLAVDKQKPRPTEGKMFPLGLPKAAS